MMAYVMKRYNGTSWVPAVKRYWDGSKWVGVDGASNFGEGWALPSSTPTPSFRLSADRILAKSDGDTVTHDEWRAETDDTVSGTTSNTPIYRAAPTGFNGHPAVEYGATEAWHQHRWTGLTSYGTGEAWQVVRVVTAPNLELRDGPYFWQIQQDGTGDRIQLWMKDYNDDFYLRLNGSSTTTITLGNMVSNTYAFRTYWNPTTVVHRNDTQIISTATDPTGIDAFQLSGNGDTTIYGGGTFQVSDWMMWKSQLTSAQRTDLWNAIQRRYAL